MFFEMKYKNMIREISNHCAKASLDYNHLEVALMSHTCSFNPFLPME